MENETAEAYLNEHVGIEAGKKVRRRDRMSISRIKFIIDEWPSIREFILRNK